VKKKIFLIKESSLVEGIQEIPDLIEVAEQLCMILYQYYGEELLIFLNSIETATLNSDKFNVESAFPARSGTIGGINESSFSTNLHGFLTESFLKISFMFFDLQQNGSALFIPSEGENGAIYVNLKFILKLFIDFYEKNNEKIFSVLPESQQQETLKGYVISIYRPSILHELQHAYDYFRSNHKDASDSRSIKYYKEKEKNPLFHQTEIGKQLYYSLPHEYWARFSSFVSELDLSDYNTFNDLSAYFKDKFEGYKFLREKDKKRLIGALYKVFSNK